MSLKAIIDWARAAAGYAGLAVCAGGREIFNEDIDQAHVAALTGALGASPGARRISAAARGLTLVALEAGGYTIVLKVAGRFPVVGGPCLEEPAFVDPSRVPGLPTREAARAEAEAALRQLGLI